jgi:hypothetical protein
MMKAVPKIGPQNVPQPPITIIASRLMSTPKLRIDGEIEPW